MKLFFKSILILSFITDVYAFAEAEILITYKDEDIAYKTIQKVIKNDLQLPTELYRFIQTNSPCKRLENVILQLCIKDGDFEIVQQNVDALRKSISHLLKDVQ